MPSHSIQLRALRASMCIDTERCCSRGLLVLLWVLPICTAYAACDEAEGAAAWDDIRFERSSYFFNIGSCYELLPLAIMAIFGGRKESQQGREARLSLSL
ncbi:hypothetical protein BKA56DRAFT_347486 [Ilyonectria sp. MPI-CAGE-AT-0026]|nr:hypothetical protein BKA56DRAFT_347486 [Ilyonectria sp. MPI-CAGE-AT-0026]